MGKCDESAVEVNMGDSASPIKPDNFSFTVPPEAPVFEPTPEEFQDPLAYISKIRPIAEKSGICKIKPPENWQPPFAVDVDRLRFTPRIQRLNELEAITRVKLNFLDQIVKFWELQGSVLKIPIVERKPLDLYSLHKNVNEAGGFDLCTTERKWSKIASRLGFPQGKCVGSILKNHYERILYPYDVFQSGGATEVKLENKGDVTPEKVSNTQTTRSSRSSTTKMTAATPPPDCKARRWKYLEKTASKLATGSGCLLKSFRECNRPTTMPMDQELEHEGSQTECALASDDTKDRKTGIVQCKENDNENKRILRDSPSKRYNCGGATRSRALREHRQSNMTVSVTPAPTDPDDPLAKYICQKCSRGDIEEQMLLCDGCDDSYHTFCLMPPLNEIPKGDWRCPRCIAQEVSKPTEAFGFEQAQREYTLQQFGEMADQFKSEYFNMPVHMVPTSTVEKEFWRIVSSIDEDVTVEYGADLHCMEHGSGFPTKATAVYPGDLQYAESSWNLNNIPVLEGSVLGYINADISGMKIPWMYVGMCFATFCWHNEDHWSYSINYLHWGEPKTWYGVPGSKAELFEDTMKSAAPELFQWQPDLLHQLVTIMNPNILMTAGVPVYRTDQNAGEFVITFPRAYHAGFNQGYNFAEAVNFTPADWLKMGRECISHYSTLRRYCVFSHDELVCKMATEADSLGLTVAIATYHDMRQMLHDERKLRKSLLEWGVTEAEREAFELLADDARQCIHCKTTCFLSAVACTCTTYIACLRHYTSLCGCPPKAHKLRYRYTLDELPIMLDKLKQKSDAYKEWADSVQNALDPETPKTCDLEGLKSHLKKSQELKMHKTELVRALETAIEDAEKCSSVIQQLDLNKMRTRTRQRDTAHDPKYRLTIEELTLFCEEIDGLACVLPEGSAVKEVLRQTDEFEKEARDLMLGEPAPDGQLKRLEVCVERGTQLCIQLTQLPPLQARLQQVKFLEEVNDLKEDFEALNLDKIDSLLESGRNVQPHYTVEAELAYLTTLKKEILDWEESAKAMLKSQSLPEEGNTKKCNSLAEVELLLERADNIKAAIPSQGQLSGALQHAKDWLAKVEEMESRESYPYFHTLEWIVKKSSTIPLRLYEKDRYTHVLSSAREWKKVTSETFIKKSWPLPLSEALSPRTSSSPHPRRGRKPPPSPPPAFTEDDEPADIVRAFKRAEEKELQYIKELRALNSRKDIKSPPQPGLTFCLCQKRQYGVMTQCELCKDWFHASCVAPYSEDAPPAATPSPTLPFTQKDPKFLCPLCTRTKRPRLESILELLVWLQKLPVRLSEGEALQCVTERAMAWQDSARAALMAPQLQNALHHQANKEKAEKLNAELKKTAAKLGNGDASLASMYDDRTASEHAYSAAPQHQTSNRLPTHMLHKLEELMMEGDLLEVSVEEAGAVWGVVMAARGAGARVWSDRKRAARRDRLDHKRHRRHNNGTMKAGKIVSMKKGSLDRQKSGSVSSNSGSTTNYLNKKQNMSGSSLMMRKHYMARQERRKRGMPVGTTKSLRGRKSGSGRRAANAAGPSGAGGGEKRSSAPSEKEKASISNTSSSDDDDEDCAASDCLRPTGKEVDWVQCDGGCEGWFHMHCVGLSKQALKEDDDYYCKSCEKNRTHKS